MYRYYFTIIALAWTPGYFALRLVNAGMLLAENDEPEVLEDFFVSVKVPA